MGLIEICRVIDIKRSLYMDELKNIKRALKKEYTIKYWDHFKLTLQRWGYNKENYIILDRQEMTPEMIELAVRVVAPHPMFPGQTRTKAIPSIPDRFIPKDVFVMWSYDKREEAEGSTIIDGSRPFCRNLVDADKLYDRTAIDAMSNEMGLPVFESGGGYWNDNGVIKPHCRHVWVQNLVRKK